MEDGEKIITLNTYYDPMQAHIVMGRLEANGIDCYMADENSVTLRPYLNQAMGGVSVRIFKKDEERCLQILSSDDEINEVGADKDDRAPDDVICPYCGSANVRYGGATEPKFHLLSLLASLFFFLPIYFRNAWHCFNCYRDFN